MNCHLAFCVFKGFCAWSVFLWTLEVVVRQPVHQIGSSVWGSSTFQKADYTHFPEDSVEVAQELQQGLGVDARIVTSERKVYLGHFLVNEMPTKHVFSISNQGPETVSFLEMAKSCGCADVALSSDNLKAGEHGDLTVTLDLREIGEKGSTIDLRTNSRNTPVVRFHVAYEVSRGLIAKRSTLAYDRVLPTQLERFDVILEKCEGWNHEEGWLKQIAVHPKELVSAVIEKEGAEFIVLQVVFQPFSNQVAHSGTGDVTLIGQDDKPIVNIPIHWTIRPRYEVRPASIVAMVGEGESVTSTIVLVSNREEQLLVEKVEASGLREFKSEITQIAKGLVSLKFTVGKPAGQLKEVLEPFIEIRISLPEPAIIRVPVFFVGDDP